jgi:hypothetical protein
MTGGLRDRLLANRRPMASRRFIPETEPPDRDDREPRAGSARRHHRPGTGSRTCLWGSPGGLSADRHDADRRADTCREARIGPLSNRSSAPQFRRCQFRGRRSTRCRQDQFPPAVRRDGPSARGSGAVCGDSAAKALFALFCQRLHRVLRNLSSFAPSQGCLGFVDHGQNLEVSALALFPEFQGLLDGILFTGEAAVLDCLTNEHLLIARQLNVHKITSFSNRDAWSLARPRVERPLTNITWPTKKGSTTLGAGGRVQGRSVRLSVTHIRVIECLESHETPDGPTVFNPQRSSEPTPTATRTTTAAKTAAASILVNS